MPMSNKIKILLLDCETAPMLGYSWDIWKEQGSMEFVIRDWYMLCWCAKWLDKKEMFTCALPDFKDAYKVEPENDSLIVGLLHELLCLADVVVTQNGNRFDLPKINAKLIQYNLPPVPPFKKVDTCLTARKVFGFSSNKLNDIGKLLGLGEKIETGGFKLWKQCMKGDAKAWKKMVTYCANDVKLLEKVYKKMLPFMSGHPNSNYYTGENGCPKCGSHNLIAKGYDYQATGKKQRYYCKDCGGWCREGKVIKNA